MELNKQFISGIIKLIPKKLKKEILKEYNLLPYGTISYSQEGEDLILARYFEGKRAGFYIDIGAHHPIRFSNTYKLYLNKWSGINIDAAPGSMNLFNRIRPRDINIEAVISNTKTTVNYYIFNEPALNTISDEIAEQKSRIPGFRIEKIVRMETVEINSLMEKNIPPDKRIDLLTIDIEGMDTIVLKDWNFDRYKPELIIIEIKDFYLSDDYDLIKFLESKNYVFYAKTVNSVIFKNCNSI